MVKIKVTMTITLTTAVFVVTRCNGVGDDDNSYVKVYNLGDSGGYGHFGGCDTGNGDNGGDYDGVSNEWQQQY